MTHEANDPDRLLPAFERDGYLLLPDFWPSGALDDICAHVDAEDAAGRRTWTLPLEAHPELLMPLLRRLLDSRLGEIAEAAMGPFLQLDVAVATAFPSDGPEHRGAVTRWHRDRWAQLPEGSYQRPLALNVITYPRGLDLEHGPLRVIPGSHVHPLRMGPDERQRPHPQEVLLCPGPADAILMHHALVHSGTANVSGERRHFLSIYLNHSWLKPSERLDGPVCRGLAQAAERAGDHRLQRLLGQDPTLNQRNNWGFMEPTADRLPDWIAADHASPAIPSPP